MTAPSAFQTQFSVETGASPEAVWALFRDVQGWPRWNAGIEHIALEGPFATGTHFVSLRMLNRMLRRLQCPAPSSSP